MNTHSDFGRDGTGAHVTPPPSMEENNDRVIETVADLTEAGAFCGTGRYQPDGYHENPPSVFNPSIVAGKAPLAGV